MNKEIKKCRICSLKNLVPIASFGNQYLTNFPERIDETLPRCPLDLVFCPNCKLLQLKHTANFDYLYKNYWYISGVNQTMRRDLADIVEKAVKLVELKDNDIVVDIGSNDSTLLKVYPEKLIKVGFEPAQNLQDTAQFKGGIIINDYFNLKAFKEKFGDKKAKVITAIAMFYDLDEPNAFVNDMVKMLDENGIIIIQLNYLPIMLERNTFDNVSHEHLEYYSLISLENLFNRHSLDIFNLEFNEVNGGSLRIYICKRGQRKISNNILFTTEKEYHRNLDKIETYRKFGKTSQKKIAEIKKTIKDLEIKGKKIYVYGASTRGNALLQACELTSKEIIAAADRNPMKWGRYMVGSWIPIISEEQARKEKPDYFLALPWQFKTEFLEREKEYLNQGGKFIFLFPEIEIYGK